MRIQVSGPAGLITDQMRAYAEYRLFAALAPYARAVRQVTVSLEPTTSGDAGITCFVEIDLGPQGQVRARGRAGHAAHAVERAANLARSALELQSKPAVAR